MIHRFFTGILVCTVFFCSCSLGNKKDSISQREKETHHFAAQIQSYLKTVTDAQNTAVEQWIKTVPLEQRVSQLFLVNIVGDSVFVPVEHTGDLYNSRGKGAPLVPGGCIFFSYNVADTPEKVMAFTDSIHDYCTARSIIPPFLSADQEGGLVNRLKHINAPLPASRRIADKLTVAAAYRLYYLQGVQMKALGLHLNLAPVSEVSTESNSEFLGDRSYGSNDRTVKYGTAAVNGYENSGIGAVLKHFPGNTNTDPHTGLPEIDWDDAELEQSVIEPFQRLADANPCGILMSHARTKAHDADTPACLSSYWVTEMLRNRIGYRGIVFSDDIFMDALQKNGFPPDKAVVMAIEAGVDCIMLSEKRFAPVAKEIIVKYKSDSAFAKKIDASVERIIRWKIHAGILALTDTGNNSWKVTVPAEKGIPERLKLFTAAWQENAQMYRQYFTD